MNASTLRSTLPTKFDASFICIDPLIANRKTIFKYSDQVRGGSKTAATSKMEHFVILVNGWKPLNYCHKALYLGCCSSPRSASAKLELNLDLLSTCNIFLIIMIGDFNVNLNSDAK